MNTDKDGVIVKGSVYGEAGVIGFSSFYNALEHVIWAIQRERREQTRKEGT